MHDYAANWLTTTFSLNSTRMLQNPRQTQAKTVTGSAIYCAPTSRSTSKARQEVRSNRGRKIECYTE